MRLESDGVKHGACGGAFRPVHENAGERIEFGSCFTFADLPEIDFIVTRLSLEIGTLTS